MQALGALCLSRRVQLRKGAVQILLERASRHPTLVVLFRCLDDAATDEDRLMAATIVQQLMKTAATRAVLIERGCIPRLIGCIADPGQRRLSRVALMALFDIVRDDDGARSATRDALPSLARQLAVSGTMDKEATYWCMVVLHQLMLLPELLPSCRRLGLVKSCVRLGRAAQGDHATLRLCHHALWLLTSTSDDDPEALRGLQVLLDDGYVACAVSSLKSDDRELVHWALGLLLELTLREIGKEEIKATPRVLRCFLSVLNSSEAAGQKIILRTLGLLALSDEAFKAKLLHSDVPAKLAVCLRSGDLELAHWAVVLLHDLAMAAPDACVTLLAVEVCHHVHALTVRRPRLSPLRNPSHPSGL